MDADSGLVFNVSTLLTEPLGSLRRYAVRDAPFRTSEGRTPVSGWVRFTRTDGSLLVEAELALEVPEICGRCLEPFGQGLVVELEEEFWPDFDPLREEQVAVPEGREGFPIVEGLLDLQEPLRQYVEISRPMQPICRADCSGPDTVDRSDSGWQSGSDADAAADAAAPADHRWDALEELRRKLG